MRLFLLGIGLGLCLGVWLGIGIERVTIKVRRAERMFMWQEKEGVYEGGRMKFWEEMVDNFKLWVAQNDTKILVTGLLLIFLVLGYDPIRHALRHGNIYIGLKGMIVLVIGGAMVIVEIMSKKLWR